MKDSTNVPSHSQLERPTTTAQRQRTVDPASRDLNSRASTVHTPSYDRHTGRPGVRLTSLSALYQPAFKPYAFSQMYSTKYDQDFPVKHVIPPSPARPDSTNYAPIDYSFSKTMYNQHFQKPQPMTLAFVVPYSRHRKNNPQPNMCNNYKYPNSSRWIWSSPTELPARDSQTSQGRGWNQGTRNPYPAPRCHRWNSR